MAFFRLVLYASKLNGINEKLIAEKNAANAISRKEKPKYGWRLKLSHLWINCKRRLRNCFINLYFLKNTAFDRFFYRLRKYGSFENYVLKSVLGFIGGYLLTYLLFLFLAVQLNMRLSIATLICCFLGCILTIGLAFSQNIRCIVFLTLPQFFSKRGRQALIAYALILTMTGPAKNSLNNMGIMSESLACGQEQLKSAVKQILDVIKKPFVAIKEALKAVIKAVKEVIKKIKEILIKIKRVIMGIIGVIKSVFQFLGRILNLCNKELGTPYQRCSRVFETAITDCQASLGPFFSWACSIGYLLESVCYIVKPFDLICMLVDFISNSIIGVVIRKIKIFIRHVKTMFYVKIKFSHSYHFESKSSKSMKDIASSIVGEVKMRTRGIVSVFEFFNCAASLFFIFLIARVIHYRHQFLTKERFDNKFLTKNLVDIDLRRAAMEKETIFPLNHRERKKYITIKAIRLLPKERKQLTEGLGLLMSTGMKIGTHMAIDYCLFWIMNLIRKYGKFQSKVQAPNIPTVHIAGEGLLADLLKAVVKSFQPLGISLEIDTVPCLPIPIPPDFDRYVQIASILFLCLLLTIFEPYGLRWRNWILCYYYPRRAKERAVWLYNHILRSRSSFLKFARRQLRRKVLGSKKITKVTCLEYLRSKTNNKCLLFFLGSDKQLACLLCGEVFRKSDKETPIRCQRPGCTAMYCKQCFEDLENVCTVCLSPIEYGDMSDFSEERDSSDEDYSIPSKLPVESDVFDSGMSNDEHTEGDEGSTDEYSYSYQEVEKVPSIITDFKTESSRDLEKQSSPDYVSMQYFDDEIELYSFKTFGFDDKDEETQFPDESMELDMEVDMKDAVETSSVASSFKEEMENRNSHKKILERDSCFCLDLNLIDNPPSNLLLNELKIKLSSIQSENKQLTSSHEGEHLEPIVEQTEDEALIQFSTDEEKEEKSTIYSRGSFTSQSKTVKLKKTKTSPISFPKGSVENPDDDKFFSDSEFSENDVKKLIGNPESQKKLHSPQSFSNSSLENATSNSEGKNKANYGPQIKSDARNTSKKEFLDGSSNYEKILTGPEIMPSKGTKSDIPGESSNNLSVSTKQRRIEFIGLQKKNKKASSVTDSSSDNEKNSTRRRKKKYKSTISTKTSKQDVPSHMKKKKSILKADSGSSIISEVKKLQEGVVVPRLNLRSLENDDESREPSSYHRQSKDHIGISYNTSPGRKMHHDHKRKFRKTNKTDKRLKGGANASISALNSEKFQQENSETSEASPCISSDQELSSPLHPFQSSSGSSVPTLIFSSESAHQKRYQTKSDLKYFDSSDTSFSLLVSERNVQLPDYFSYDSKVKDIENFEDRPASMTTDISKVPSSENNHSIIKSSESVSTKKSVRISEVVEESEGTPDEEEEFGATDASSDLSISVQENILGIPRTTSKKKERIDWKHEREIRSIVAEDSEAPEDIEAPEESDREKSIDDPEIKEREDLSSTKESNNSRDKTTESTLSKDSSGHELNDPMEPHQNISNDDSSDQREKIDFHKKFFMSEDDPRLTEIRRERKCGCCKCREKLPIVHHVLGGDPNRKILLQTGIDSCTQTCVDRSDQGSQVDIGSKTTKNSFSSVASNKSCSVRCKLREGGVNSNMLQKPEKHCRCSICSAPLERLEEDRPRKKDSFCDNPCLQEETEVTFTPKKCSITRKKTIGTFCKPQTRDQVCSAKKLYGQCEEVYPCERLRETMLPRQESKESLLSNEESYRDRLDLPYQDNDEYKRLVRELEEKLVARNRERVRKTMREFEKCSTRNQNLRKPILYDDSSCGEEPILTKIVDLKTGDADNRNTDKRKGITSSPRRKCTSKEVNTIETMPREVEPRTHKVSPRPPRYYYERDPTHWQMDTATGEWYRVSDVDICDPYDTYEPDARYAQPVQMGRRRMVERYEEEPHCEDCDDLNRRYGHRYNILFCPRHRLDRVPPRHRKR